MEHMPAVGVFVVVLRNGGMAADDLVGCFGFWHKSCF